MVYKIEQSDIDGFDYKVNETIYFSIIGDDNDDVMLDYYCEYLTNTEVKEILEPMVNDILRTFLTKVD